MNKKDILEQKIEKDYKDMMAVINSTSLPLFVEDTIEDMHILISTLIEENKELKEEHDLFMEGELYTAKQLKNLEKDRDKYYIHKSKVEELLKEIQEEKIKLKEKIKWKPIKEYNKQEYDWVLVKYFDGEYECVPEVAEQRNDGKWYTTDRQIPFEVKYFFDMQSLLGKE